MAEHGNFDDRTLFDVIGSAFGRGGGGEEGGPSAGMSPEDGWQAFLDGQFGDPETSQSLENFRSWLTKIFAGDRRPDEDIAGVEDRVKQFITTKFAAAPPDAQVAGGPRAAELNAQTALDDDLEDQEQNPFVPRPTAQPGGPPPGTQFTPDRQRRIDLSLDREGRGQLFDEFLSRQPRASGPIQAARERQFDPFSRLFEIGQAFNDPGAGPSDTFSNFLPEGLGSPNEAFSDAQLRRVGGLLSGDNPADTTVLRDFREDLLGNRGRQFNTLFSFGEAGRVPRARREGAGRIGRRLFNREHDIRGIEQGFGRGRGTDRLFDDFRQTGNRFSGPTREAQQTALSDLADLVSRGEEGLEGLSLSERGLFDKFFGNQQAQFDLALDARLRDTPFALRGGGSQECQSRF